MMDDNVVDNHDDDDDDISVISRLFAQIQLILSISCFVNVAT